MMETIKVSIAAQEFELEAKAFDMLEDYLDQMKQTLGGAEQGEQIIANIEKCIAERIVALCPDRKVVSVTFLADVFGQLGYIYIPSAKYAQSAKQSVGEKVQGSEHRVISLPRFLLYAFLILIGGGVLLGALMFWGILSTTLLGLGAYESMAGYGAFMFILVPVLIVLFSVFLPLLIGVYLIYRIVVGLLSRGRKRYAWLVVAVAILLAFLYVRSKFLDGVEQVDNQVQIFRRNSSNYVPQTIIDSGDTIVTEELFFEDNQADSVIVR